MVTVTLTPILRKGIKYACIAPDSCDGHCCWGAGSIYIYGEDIERFLKYFKMTLDDFLEKHVTVDEIPCHHFKHDKLIPSLEIKETKEKAACHFQTDKGLCEVYKVRPFQCVGYPFWKMNTKNKAAWDKVVVFCPGAQVAPAMADAHFYTAAEIKKLVKAEQQAEYDWEKAMIDWKGDYKAYLRDFLDKKKLER
nr:YkgJ family cysteine cluster protein [Candidatus Sigynarchaeota archaeon]